MRRMNRTFCTMALLLSCVLTESSNGQTADTLASVQTKKIFLYLKGLNTGTTRRLISGHQLNTQFQPLPSYDSVVPPLFALSGKTIGLVGIDYQRILKGPVRSTAGTNAPLINHFRNGGLVAVMCSFSNPWTDSTMNDTTSRSRLDELLQTGTAAHKNWMQKLDSVAAGFRQLQDSGVTVLFRPLHEMNGTWFWWGSRSATQPSKSLWTSLWKQVFTYFTETKQLHNILWVYAPSARGSHITDLAYKPDTAYYPGNNYVDIIGVDVYEDTLDIASYMQLRSYGKPLAICEFGPSPKTAIAMQQYDFRILLNQIRSKYPDIVYWMSWNDFGNQLGSKYFGMTNQKNVKDLLQDPWVANREDLRWQYVTSRTSDAGIPPSSAMFLRNYPNPFNPLTRIQFSLPEGETMQFTTLRIYDLLGREVRTLVMESIKGGVYSVDFDGSAFASGTYILQLQRGALVQTQRMVLLK